MNLTLRKAFVLSTMGLALSLVAAKAQMFTNGTLTLDGSNIENVGSVVYAYDFANTTTVNGVTFTATSNTGTGTTFSMSNSGGLDQTGGGTASDGTDSNYSAAVQALNAFGAYGNFTLVLNDLTPGTTYAVQLILDANLHDARQQAFDDTTNGSAPYPTSATVYAGGNQNSANATYAHGPYAIPYITDTFTATGSSETINALVGGGNGAEFSGFVLEVAPEPGTWALTGLGLAGLGLYLARRPRARC